MPLLGPLLVVFFGLSQAFRDVYLGGIFQRVEFFTVLLIAFGLSTIIFAGIATIRTPEQWRKLRGHGGTILAMNLTTAMAWSSYFFALTWLEPAAVNTLHSGMGPLTVVVMGGLGMRLAKAGHIGRAEMLSYVGIALSLAALWWVVLTGRSGLPVGNVMATFAGLCLQMVSGSAITISMMYSKRMSDAGINAEVITALRYFGLIALAAVMTFTRSGFRGIESPLDFATIALLATALMIVPLFALQVGITRTSPLTTHVIRALGPVFVFALEQVDGRMLHSLPTLVCILAYSACVIASNITHGWKEDRPKVAKAPA
jgi:drug/metabolite transporter (DMT)-like permease